GWRDPIARSVFADGRVVSVAARARRRFRDGDDHERAGGPQEPDPDDRMGRGDRVAADRIDPADISRTRVHASGSGPHDLSSLSPVRRSTIGTMTEPPRQPPPRTRRYYLSVASRSMSRPDRSSPCILA